eukprot:NODE_2052_length_519_cov_1.189394_g2037_i0.p2 GENE.NODE_2052_length_519_cov_1.189394_g2037_i0~~NODE_2052_length_519_cov_1.189394_g2037_i0.p2  ORF type:complete len:107 (-),score=50.21 NODE_2052_length_519_cov_1.189394_g2037_i0:38-358(-)
MVKFFIKNYQLCTKKDIEKLIARLDRMEKLIKKTGGAPKAAPRKRKGAVPASDIVADIVNSAPGEITFAEIMEKTGFPEKKLRNVVFRLTSSKRIQTQERGVYIKA